MVLKEFYRTRTDGVELYRSYSNKGFKIHKVGTDEIYNEAIDTEYSSYLYEETNILIENDK